MRKERPARAMADRLPVMTQREPFAELGGSRGLDRLTDIVSRAAAAVLAIDRTTIKWRTKADRSPICTADEVSNAVIVEGLTRLLPGVPIVSEEASEVASAPGAWFALVDPLDGTREYLAGRDEFTVNIAFVSGGRPAVGIIAAPALGLVWRGVVGRGAERLRLAAGAVSDQAAERQAVHARRRPADGFVATFSRSHFDTRTSAFLQRLPILARVPCGSSLKFARIAEGSADLYVRLARTCEWDVAAGHAILAAAGGTVTAADGTDLVYGRAPHFHIPGFIAWGDPSAAEQTLERATA